MPVDRIIPTRIEIPTFPVKDVSLKRLTVWPKSVHVRYKWERSFLLDRSTIPSVDSSQLIKTRDGGIEQKMLGTRVRVIPRMRTERRLP